MSIVSDKENQDKSSMISSEVINYGTKFTTEFDVEVTVGTVFLTTHKYFIALY